MALESISNRVNYIGNGAVSVYPYSFKIFNDSDLLVIKKDLSGTEIPLSLGADYSVSGVGEFGGGDITLSAGNLPSGYKLIIRRVVPLKQSTDLRNQGDYYPATVEDQLDQIVMQNQQQQDEISRTITLSETTLASDFNPSLPATIAGQVTKVIMTNATGDGFAIGPSAGEISGASASALAAATSAAESATHATTSSGFADDAAASAASILTYYSGLDGRVVALETDVPYQPKTLKVALSYANYNTQPGSVYAHNDGVKMVLPAKTFLQSIIFRPTAAFAGSGITEVEASIGTVSDPEAFASYFSVLSAPSGSDFKTINVGAPFSFTTSETVVVRIRTTGGLLTALTSGAFDLYLLTRLLQ